MNTKQRLRSVAETLWRIDESRIAHGNPELFSQLESVLLARELTSIELATQLDEVDKAIIVIKTQRGES